MNLYRLTGVSMVWCLVLIGTARAANVVEADFNDLSAGLLHGQYGGTGWALHPPPPNDSDPNPWNEPELIGYTQLIAGDLVAPSGTNYAVAQDAGTALHAFEGGYDYGTPGRFLDPVLSGSDDSVSPEDWWFSFLFRLEDSQSRAGIVVEGVNRILVTGGPGDGSPGPTEVFTEAEGSSNLGGDFDGDGLVSGLDFLKWQTDLGDSASLALWESNYGFTANSNRVNVPFTLGADHLLIGQVVDEGGAVISPYGSVAQHTADLLKVWIDPDVNNFDINNPDVSFVHRDFDEHPSSASDPWVPEPGVSKVSILAYALGDPPGGGGHIDHLRFSDASNAQDVILSGAAPAQTANIGRVPEPASCWMLVVGALLAGVRLRPSSYSRMLSEKERPEDLVGSVSGE